MHIDKLNHCLVRHVVFLHDMAPQIMIPKVMPFEAMKRESNKP
jgi:hypothetical protein